MALSALAVLPSALPAVAAAAGSISGTVTDTATDLPIDGLQVCAWPVPEDGNVSQCSTTDSNGEYAIALNPHGYRVVFDGDPLGYETQAYDETASIWSANIVTVGTDSIPGIDARMRPYGQIEGVVREAGTEAPLEDVRACAWEVGTERAGLCAWTDATGAYLISKVRPGEYAVGFMPKGNQLYQAYNGKEDLSEADPVSVGLSEVVTGIDVDLAPGAQVEGTVRRADNGQPLQGVEICARGITADFLKCGSPGGDGSYLISALPPGEYLIAFWPPNSEWQSQFWDHGASWGEADPLQLTAGTTTAGIDADMARKEPTLSPPQIESNPLSPPSTGPSGPFLPPRQSTRPSGAPQEPTHPSSAPRRARNCRKDFHKKRTGAKVRCVRVHKRHHTRAAAALSR